MKIKSFTQVLFVRIKLLYAELSPFQGAIVSNTQYSTSGDLIYSKILISTVFLKNDSMQTDMDIQT